ncbi:hypothetical protein DP757_18400 [Salmonella enterica subsp. enterica]|nr:hypothetical protein [Salmonella enterica subsp. enterica serovar Canada]EBG0543895.1 hypothetical protein [Salmonella enterica subsp. enterica serovar Ank]EBH2790833.1 hypothetical protein [Salmonella enterica subsp. enterica serovar Ank]
MFEKENVMPGCISACSCVASPTPPEPKDPPKPKWIELKGYCVTCTHESDIRPPSEREDKRQRKVQAIELYWLRRLLDDLGIQEGTSQNTAVKPTNCGLPFFPVDPGERETDV